MSVRQPRRDEVLPPAWNEDGQALEALKKAEAEFKDMGMDYWLKKTQEVLARVE